MPEGEKDKKEVKKDDVNPDVTDTPTPPEEAEVVEDSNADVMAELAAMKKQLAQERADFENDKATLKSTLSEVDKMKKDIKKAAGMDEPKPAGIPHQLKPGYDYDPPDYEQICSIVGAEFAKTLEGFAKLRKMETDEKEKWACKAWNHIMHMQDYYEERAIIKYKTWIRNLRNVQLSI